MKQILGLDLGVGSVGWSLIQTDDNGIPTQILGMGSRIVPLSTDDANEFSRGNAISKNQKRTQKRTQRKGYDRYQLRRSLLTQKLSELGMLPDERLIKLPVMDLWQLRADAATEDKRITLPEIGRVLYHINQKRGYKHARSDDSEEKNQREYVQSVNARHEQIRKEGLTIGQFFAKALRENEQIGENGMPFYTYRIREQVFPRAAYLEEFDKIMACQRVFYPDILTEENIRKIRDEIIFYQRPLKSCKHLVAHCEFSLHEYKTTDGRSVISGPKVAPRSSPIFQVCKIWESINNLVLRNREGEVYPFTKEERQRIFDFMDNHDRLTATDLYKILGISKKDGWWAGKAIGKGLQGNTTKTTLAKCLHDRTDLLRFNLETVDSKQIDTETGEVLRTISPSFENEPLYRLWHIIYSMPEKNEIKAALRRQFGIEDNETLDCLASIDFVKAGYGNKSARFIREILPYLISGLKYSEACDYIGINHSNSLTREENEARRLLDRLPQIQKNELRQPVIEKILNQMVAVVNALLDQYGHIDEIRVELARELKQSRDERNETFLNINKRERENNVIGQRIQEYGLSPTRSRIQKYRLWEESKHLCFYCGQPVGVTEFLSGSGVEIEHIIPRSLFFDDSFANKICACRKCNAEKNNRTAFDYMKSKSDGEFEKYTRRIEQYYTDKAISKTKRERLLTAAKDIPQDFIDRQLRQSQYISKKAVDMLKLVCRNVWTTSGSVTDFLRHVWGYDSILHDLNLPRYRDGGLADDKIPDWTKRLDHRHHAIDALTIASTRQSYIQRLNHLNTERDIMFAEADKQSESWQGKRSLLEEWTESRPHFSVDAVKEATDGILVSFKSGKKVATPGKRYLYQGGKKQLIQDGLMIPRGPLSEESVYGRIHSLEKEQPIKKLFENPETIFKPYIRKLVEERIESCGGDRKKALDSVKKQPIWLDEKKTIQLTHATCISNQFVIRYPVSSLKAKDIGSIVDGRIRRIIQKRVDEDGEKALKMPLFADEAKTIQIHSVRLFTGLQQVEPLRFENGVPVGFVKPGNNHHVAIYKDQDGRLFEHIVTLWHAVERKRYGIPVIIEDTNAVWDKVLGQELPEAFLNGLPKPGAKLVLSLQQGEMFILGMPEEEYEYAMKARDFRKLNKYLYRVQKIASSDYCFRYHIETVLDDSKEALRMHKFYRCQSLQSLVRLFPHKVRISILGEILGEA